MKINKFDTPTWSGETYDLYSWLAECETVFTAAAVEFNARGHLMRQAMSSSKRKPLTNILEWDEFKSRLILEYGSLHEFGRSVQNQFLHLSQFSTKREVAEILAPKLKELKTVIECVGSYHNISTVQNIILNTTLNEAIVRCLPSKFNISYSDKLADYTHLDPMNQEPVNMFYFNAKFVERIELGFKANPITFDHASNPVNIL